MCRHEKIKVAEDFQFMSSINCEITKNTSHENKFTCKITKSDGSEI